MNIGLKGADKVSRALSNAQKTLRKNTVPIIEEAAQKVASGAMARAVQHPSGLWRGKNGRTLTPSYRVKKGGEYLYRVETPGSQVGKAEAMSEFARLAVTNSGAAMVRALDSAYGRGGGSGNGRILWATYDDMAGQIVADVQAATEKAAAEIEKNMGDA